MARTLNNSMRITPDALWGQGYSGFVDVHELPSVVAHKKKQDAAWSDYQKATDYALGYLGGRTSGTQDEYNEAMRRYAASDAASSKHKTLQRQFNTVYDRALGNWASQHGIAYNADRARGENPWSWIGGQDPQLAEQKPGQSPGDDRTKEPYDKDWPPKPIPQPIDTAFLGMFGKKENQKGPATTKTQSGARDAQMILGGMGDEQKFIDTYGVSPRDYMNLPQAGTQGDQSFDIQGGEDTQIAGLGTALKIGGALAVPYAIKKVIQTMSGGQEPTEAIKENLQKRQVAPLIRINQQSRTGGSQTLQEAATTAAGSQGTKDKKRYSNLRIRTGGGGNNNNIAQLKTGLNIG